MNKTLRYIFIQNYEVLWYIICKIRSGRSRVADDALVLVVPKKAIFSSRHWVRSTMYASGFHHSGSHHSGLFSAHPMDGEEVQNCMSPNWARCIVAALLLFRVWVSWIQVITIRINDVQSNFF
jgi:hypothetical protein